MEWQNWNYYRPNSISGDVEDWKQHSNHQIHHRSILHSGQCQWHVPPRHTLHHSNCSNRCFDSTTSVCWNFQAQMWGCSSVESAMIVDPLDICQWRQRSRYWEISSSRERKKAMKLMWFSLVSTKRDNHPTQHWKREGTYDCFIKFKTHEQDPRAPCSPLYIFLNSSKFCKESRPKVCKLCWRRVECREG